MRLIDADALHEALKNKQKWVVRCGDKHNEGYTYDQVHFAIDDAPSIDIVFCKECRHKQQCRKAVEHITHDLTSVTIGYKSVEWCSYGEREGE